MSESKEEFDRADYEHKRHQAYKEICGDAELMKSINQFSFFNLCYDLGYTHKFRENREKKNAKSL